jgi:hypothetical protein
LLRFVLVPADFASVVDQVGRDAQLRVALAAELIFGLAIQMRADAAIPFFHDEV